MNKKENAFFDNPTREQIDSVCLSYRHDFGLLDKDMRDQYRVKAVFWIEAWMKELRYLDEY